PHSCPRRSRALFRRHHPQVHRLTLRGSLAPCAAARGRFAPEVPIEHDRQVVCYNHPVHLTEGPHMTEHIPPRNRAERRAAARSKGRRAAGAALTATKVGALVAT